MHVSCQSLIAAMLCCWLTACTPWGKDPCLEAALSQAGNNREELERVLEHYQHDSLKLEAAKFLIRNMPGHYSLADTNAVNRYYDAADTLFALPCFPFAARDTLNKWSKRYARLDWDTVSDLKIITSDFLIRNIDDAFDRWRNGTFARHLDFKQFCEYLLPYKVEDGQYLDDWRTYLKGPYADRLDELDYSDWSRHSAISAATVVNDNLRNKRKTFFIFNNDNSLPIFRYRTLAKKPYGMCDDYANMTVAVMRSLGIPVTSDYTPQWPDRSWGHGWNVVLANRGKNIVFSGGDTNPGVPHYLDSKMAKVYRRSYAPDPVLMDLHSWTSMGKQVARTVSLEYHDVPSGGLYWLRDLSKGKEERIFTYELGEQVWW